MNGLQRLHRRHRLRALLLAGLLPWLGGCALWPGQAPGHTAVPAGAAAASGPGVPVASASAPGAAASAAAASRSGPAMRAVMDLRIQAPSPLDELLRRHLDLARLQQLPVGEPLGQQELARLVAVAPQQVRELLQTEGYFDPEVQVRREPAVGAGLPTVQVSVNPGPRTVVTRLQVQALGPLAQAADAGDADAARLRDSLAQGLPARTGQPFRNADWADSKQQVLTRLHAGAYAAASLGLSQADVDADVQQAELRIQALSGPLFRAGPLAISGLKQQDESTVRHLAGFGPGAPLTEQRLLDYQDRLQKSGLYSSVSVTYDPDADQAAQTPVRVRLTEQPLQQATVGVGYSANTGPRATLEHTHRRPFDRALTAYNKLEWGRDRQSWTGDFQSHPGPGFYRRLLGVQIERELSDTDVVLSQRLRLGRSQDTRRIERLSFVELLRSRKAGLGATRDNADSLSTANALTANHHVVWRDLDNVLLPTKGLSVALQLGAGQASSPQAPDGPVLRLYGRLTGYWPLGSTWFGQARVEAGQVFKRDEVRIPDALGFRAGGDESVRGYGYRTLAPLDANGNTVSGLVLATASVELARPISPRLPQVLGAVFVDAGRAAERWQGLRPALGVGAGVRWRSPVGPLRMDLAWGEELRALRLHLSVGIAL